MKTLDSREVTNEITKFLYLWRSDKFLQRGRIFDIFNGPQFFWLLSNSQSQHFLIFFYYVWVIFSNSTNSKNQVAKKGKKEKIKAQKQRNILYELVRVQNFFFDFFLKK